MDSRMDSTDAKLDRLRGIFAPMKAVLVAFSGGVDSTLVLKVAHDAIGDRAIALTTTSPTMPDEDCDTAIAMAQSIGARHLIVDSNELEIPGYAANPVNRCYLCKTNLFTVCEAKARELGIGEIADGLNLDDLHDYRPGMKAAAEKRVRHPLVESDLGKAEVRELSRGSGCAPGIGPRRRACPRASPTGPRLRRKAWRRSRAASNSCTRSASRSHGCAITVIWRGSKSRRMKSSGY